MGLHLSFILDSAALALESDAAKEAYRHKRGGQQHSQAVLKSAAPGASQGRGLRHSRTSIEHQRVSTSPVWF
jgi:hypothetical protein